MKLVLTYAGGATLLPSVKAAFSVMEPMEKNSGSIINEIKVNSLKAHWKIKPTINRANDVDGGNGEGQFLNRGMLVTMNVALARGSNASVTFC